MAKLRFQGEWKIWVSVAAVIGFTIAYLYVVSRPPMEGTEYLWNVTKVLDARSFSLKGSGSVIQFRLIGAVVPRAMEAPAQEFLAKSLENQWVRIKVVKDDPKGVKEGFMYLSGEDMVARLIRQGFAEIDREAQGFDVRPYMDLEQEARKRQKGMWSQSDQGAKEK